MIDVDSLWKRFAGSETPILHGVSFHVKRGEIYTLLGPSGCGKTTSLRSIAGIETPDSGKITLGDRVVFSSSDAINVRTDRRRIGMVFQSYAIWPHMTVAGNIAYPLEAQRVPQDEINRRVMRALDIVGLSELRDRPAPNLSGGQQQRVALARAIVAEPDVLLLDEPLSNLDAKLRAQMRRDLLALQRRLGHTTVYVTHDQEEALSLSHRIAVMRTGEIVEEGDPRSLYQHPRHPFSAGFLGSANFIPCRISGRPRDGERVEVQTVFGRFSALARPGEGTDAKLFFRPNNVRILADAEHAEVNIGRARITEVQFLGDTIDITACRIDTTLSLRGSPSSSSLTVNQDISFSIDPAFCIAFIPNVLAN